MPYSQLNESSVRMDANNLSDIDRGKSYQIRIDHGVVSPDRMNGIGDD
jgi:hypothetical protein